MHEPDDVLEAAYALARDIIANTSEVSTAVIKQMLNRLSGLDSPFPATPGFPAHRRAPGARGHGGRREVVPREAAAAFPLTVPADLPQWLPWMDDGRNAVIHPAPTEPRQRAALGGVRRRDFTTRPRGSGSTPTSGASRFLPAPKAVQRARL